MSRGPLVVRLWCTNGEPVRGLSTQVRPPTDLYLRDSERVTCNPEALAHAAALSRVVQPRRDAVHGGSDGVVQGRIAGAGAFAAQ